MQKLHKINTFIYVCMCMYGRKDRHASKEDMSISLKRIIMKDLEKLAQSLTHDKTSMDSVSHY